MVVGENGKKSAHAAEYIPVRYNHYIIKSFQFDPSIIPLKKWQQNEPEKLIPPPYENKAGNRDSMMSSFTTHTGYSIGKMPGDEEIYAELKRMLASADLMTITKKQLRDDLSAMFKVDLNKKKQVINDMINDILSE